MCIFGSHGELIRSGWMPKADQFVPRRGGKNALGQLNSLQEKACQVIGILKE